MNLAPSDHDATICISEGLNEDIYSSRSICSPHSIATFPMRLQISSKNQLSPNFPSKSACIATTHNTHTSCVFKWKSYLAASLNPAYARSMAGGTFAPVCVDASDCGDKLRLKLGTRSQMPVLHPWCLPHTCDFSCQTKQDNTAQRCVTGNSLKKPENTSSVSTSSSPVLISDATRPCICCAEIGIP